MALENGGLWKVRKLSNFGAPQKNIFSFFFSPAMGLRPIHLREEHPCEYYETKISRIGQLLQKLCCLQTRIFRNFLPFSTFSKIFVFEVNKKFLYACRMPLRFITKMKSDLLPTN